jgi:hypothetical protein
MKPKTLKRRRRSASRVRMVRRFFRDIESGPNHQNGKEYHAAGIVLEKVADGCGSLKDMTVMYLNPFTGDVEYRWRSTNHTLVYECTEDDGPDWVLWETTRKKLEMLKRMADFTDPTEPTLEQVLAEG